MEALMHMKCVACRKDAPTVTEDELAAFLPHVPHWKIVERDGINRLERSYRFKDFAQALSFTNQVGELAEAEGHHPARDTLHVHQCFHFCHLVIMFPRPTRECPARISHASPIARRPAARLSYP